MIWQIDDWIFRDAPEIDANIYLPADLYRRNARGIARYLFSGAMARESLWILARSIPLLQPVVARLTNGCRVQVSDPDVDDIYACRPISTSQVYNATTATAAFSASPIPRTAQISARDTTTTRWSGISRTTPSA